MIFGKGNLKNSLIVDQSINRYSHTHLWLLIPFFITVLGFSRYWLGFSEAPLHWHLHGLSAMTWYGVLIIQPYLISRKKISLHRKLGIFGVFVAGAVFISAIQVISGNMNINEGPRVAIKYSTSLSELMTMIGFAFAVLAGIYSVRKTDLHAAWMISTVFWVLPPATVRLMFLVLMMIYKSPENLPLPPVILNVLNIGLLLLIICFLIFRHYRKQKVILMPYVVVAFFSVLRLFIIFGLKDSLWVESFIKRFFES